jgi:phage terminase large subunit GpA-like protein
MPAAQIQPSQDDIDFLIRSFNSLTDNREYQLPSRYNEDVRYLPKELTPKGGYYDYNYTPYLRKIVDYMSPLSDVHEIVFMKPSQIGATTGALEGSIAYNIGCVPRTQLYVSADQELVQTGMTTKVERLIDGCNLRHLISAQTNTKTKKTGDKAVQKEYPGGFLHAVGARNPGKLRQMSYQVMLLDELDGFPDSLGDEGDPVSLALNRTMAFMASRKILYLSTPLVLQTSKIYKKYKEGDQQMFYVPCVNCGEYIVLHFELKETETATGDRAGIIFDVKSNGKLISESVKYRTQCCGKYLMNEQKTLFLPQGDWRATAEADYEGIVSLWLESLYSPPGMYSWIDMSRDWLKAWDPLKNKVKDIEEMKLFYNTKRGLPFEKRGESVKYERAVEHRRAYPKNTILNHQIVKETGHPILLLTCQCDIHQDNIMANIIAWSDRGTSYHMDFRIIEGKTIDYNDPCWKILEDIIENETWIADNGYKYRIRTTLIDAGYRTDQVYEFCSQYSGGVYPVFGRDKLTDNVTFQEASTKTVEKAGTMCYHINTTITKDRVAAAFLKRWETGELMPDWRPNFPEDFKDDIFQQFGEEWKAEKRNKITNRFEGFFWVHNKGADNHIFDCFSNGMAALQMIAENTCYEILELKDWNWDEFWTYAKAGHFYKIK